MRPASIFGIVSAGEQQRFGEAALIGREQPYRPPRFRAKARVAASLPPFDPYGQSIGAAPMV
jgi:hypothetical protein